MGGARSHLALICPGSTGCAFDRKFNGFIGRKNSNPCQFVAAGTGPAYRSPIEESFYILQGTLTVHVGVKTLTAAPGDLVCLPRGIAHSFQNTGSVYATFLLVATPAGLEKFFEEAFYPAADCADTPPMTDAFPGRVLTAASKCGIEFHPPA